MDIHYNYYPSEGAKIDIARANLSPLLNRILEDCPIMTSRFVSSGVHHNFDDFRNARLDPKLVKMLVVPGDSLCELSPNSPTPSYDLPWNWPWAIADGDNLYLFLANGRYVRLARRENTFYFRLPPVVPDMYALLSAEQNTTYGTDDASYSGGDIGSAAVYGLWRYYLLEY